MPGPYEAIAELQINMRISARGYQNRHCFGVHNLIDGWQQDIAGSWYVSCSEALVERCSNEVYLNGLTVRQIWPAGVDDYHYPDPTGPTGPRDLPPLPPFVTPKILWRTGLPGRSYRGRTFFTGFCADDVFMYRLTDDALAALEHYAELLLSAFGQGGLYGNYEVGVLSRRTGGHPRPQPIITPITTYDVLIDVGSNRHRSVYFHA
jgi:hypothetical protein